ncbi:transposase family protein [Streptomyces sp. NPDC058683]|uniref:transposase family protein n=1 Tax=Streptomyces sp. NPDC058683 TaxID=3346597 RepID=UPI0036640E69
MPRNGQESLVAALSEVSDLRDARGIRHRLPTAVGGALAAVLAGSTSVYAIGQWIAGCSQKTLKVGHEGQRLAGCDPQRPGTRAGSAVRAEQLRLP